MSRCELSKSTSNSMPTTYIYSQDVDGAQAGTSILARRATFTHCFKCWKFPDINYTPDIPVPRQVCDVRVLFVITSKIKQAKETKNSCTQGTFDHYILIHANVQTLHGIIYYSNDVEFCLAWSGPEK